ncbi:MAG: glycosyltransferase [Flavobacteriales bacterium]|nr:glycosyltransferase [Flavobacteriales bacterium]
MGLISILMPVKNAGLYLKDCLESIIKQTEINWELITVNDHSSDNSLNILQEFSQKDSRISVWNNEGNGIIEALRMGLKKSNGVYIHRMDADDLMPSYKLELLKKNLVVHGENHIITGKVKYFSEQGVSNGYIKYQNWLNSLCDNNSHWDEIYKECVIASPCWLVHRSDLIASGAFEPNQYPEDYDLVFRFYKQGLKVISINETLHLWRDHAKRTSRNDPNYESVAFFALKLSYFFELDRDLKRPLVIWGAGTKGKQMAKILNRKQIKYTWVSNNPNKHGKEIYEKILKSYETILKTNNPQIIITVAQRNAKQEIISFLRKLGLQEYNDYYFFR